MANMQAMSQSLTALGLELSKVLRSDQDHEFQRELLIVSSKLRAIQNELEVSSISTKGALDPASLQAALDRISPAMAKADKQAMNEAVNEAWRLSGLSELVATDVRMSERSRFPNLPGSSRQG